MLALHGPNFCRAASTIVAWGADESHQTEVPAGLNQVVAVAAGASHSLALNADGTVVAWGLNTSGQTTIPTNLVNAVMIGAGSNYSLALQNDGMVVVWGGIEAAPPDLTNVLSIAAGWTHALALKRDGTVEAWGSQTNVPPGLTNVIAIAAGKGQSLALLGTGEVAAWGDNAYAKAVVPPGVKDAVGIAAGADHSLAILRGGSVVAWGRNDFGQSTVPAGLTNVVAVSAGALHSVALRADGTWLAWGDNTYGQVSPGPGAVALNSVSAGAYFNLGLEGSSAPSIVVSPADQTVFVSGNVSFQVSAVGQQPLTYQWQHNGNDIPGATDAVLILRNVQLSDQGTYVAQVKNSLGSAASLPAVLSVLGGVADTTPQDQTVICGDNATFSAHATGPAPFKYQWQFQNQAIPGATQTSLMVTNVSSFQAGVYSVVISNAYYWTNLGANLTVTVEPPQITSPATASATEGVPFSYAVQALHSPSYFVAQFLPSGLSIDPTNGVISGVPAENGVFFPILGVTNACASASQMITLTVAPALPVIRGPSQITGTEGSAISRKITATGSPTLFGGQNLPPGISVDPLTGTIAGLPIYGGAWSSTVWASNVWGVGQGTVQFSIANAPIDNLSIENLTYTYSAPYLLDFQFSLYTMTDTNDPASGHGVVADAKLLSALCLEDDVATGSETGAQLAQGNSKVMKTYLVLDYTESIASLANGDSNSNGISDAVDGMVNGAISFVNQQPSDGQVGVYEFHREDLPPNKVLGLTTDKGLVAQSIGGIWTNYVQGFPAGSRCWDAVMAAINDLGASNRDEQHYVVLISDGRDESSTNTMTSVIAAAAKNNVKVYCVGFGTELDTNTLQNLSAQTQGKYHTATNAADVVTQFAELARDSRCQYILRWATLKRGANPASFMPSFQIAYQGIIAASPTNPWYMDTNNPIVDTNAMPPTTNYNTLTNFIIGYYFPASNAGPVTVGSLRLSPDAEVSPTAITLRASYVPRYIRQLRLHYRANWPASAQLDSAQPGEMLAGWTLTESDDGAGGKWALLSSPNPADLGTSLPFASFGNLLTFSFQDIIDPTNPFSVFDIDNTIYTNTGGQSFAFDLTNLVQNFPLLPYGTPVPWLIAAGYSSSNQWVQAELLDPDGDGAPNWQEYRANTDPLDATSVFQVQSTTRLPDGRFQVVFSSALNRSYRVEASTDLVNWATVQDNIPGSGQPITVIDSRPVPFAGTAFYRVLVY